MSNLLDAQVSDNIVADATESAAPAANAEAVAGDAVSRQLAEIDSFEDEITTAAIALYDDPQSLCKHARFGGVVVRQARGLKKLFEKAAADRGATRRFEPADLKSLIEGARRKVMLTTTLSSRNIRIDIDLRVYFFCEAVRPFAANVEKLSYRTVANYLIPYVTIDRSELTAEVAKGWTTFLAETIALQLGSSPLSGDALKGRIAAHQKSLDAERDGKIDPEKLVERERKALIAASEAACNATKDKIVQGVNDALNGKTTENGVTIGKMEPIDVIDTVERIFASCDESIPLTKTMLRQFDCMDVQNARLLIELVVGAGNVEAREAMQRKISSVLATAAKSRANEQVEVLAMAG